MKEGYWANYNTGKMFLIRDHEVDIRQPGVAKKMGVPDKVVSAFGKFRPEKDRDKFLLFIMQNSPLMRIRGHGDFASFEYSSRVRSDPLDMIWIWGKKNAGPFTGLMMTNFATGEKSQMVWDSFEKAMDEGGYEAVMRVAKVVSNPVRKKIAAELLALSREVLCGP